MMRYDEVYSAHAWICKIACQSRPYAFCFCQATPKDYFVGALSGPGYMYPKVVPPSLLPGRITSVNKKMTELDLSHFIIFDASDTRGQHTVTGDTCLNSTKILDSYFEYCPQCQGFLNGYAPTFTSARRGNGTHGRSLICFNYYLDPSRSVPDAVKDIQMLATVNEKRPYFLAVHVREFSTVGKVKSIVDALSADDFVVQPVDSWFELANAASTVVSRLC